jgi:hypothetical protein
MPDPLDLHGRHLAAGAQPLGEVLPAYANRNRQYQQEIADLRRRLNRSEERTHRIAVSATWMILAVILITSLINWAVALVVLGVVR